MATTEIVETHTALVSLGDHLAHPNPEISLEQLIAELNALAKIRHQSRLAFCMRLAMAYLAIAGRPFGKRIHDDANKRFMLWCRANLRSATGKEYSTHTLYSYLSTGFSGDPAAYIERSNHRGYARRRQDLGIAKGIRHALAGPGQVVSLAKARQEQKRLKDGDVALEVNTLMSSWEQASAAARASFIYLVTGQRIAS